MAESEKVFDESVQTSVRASIESRERVVSVLFWFDADLPLRPACVQFIFEKTSIVVTVRGDDDTVEIHAKTAAPVGFTQHSEYLFHLADDIRGKRMTWVREMTNQFGYNDGIQIDFEDDNGAIVGIVMIAAASCLNISIVSRVS